MRSEFRAAIALALGLCTALACGESKTADSKPAAGGEAASDADKFGFTAPSAETRKQNAEVAKALPLADPQAEQDALRGLVASEKQVRIPGDGGRMIWDTAELAYQQGAAAPAVNPSLWRQALLNNHHGLFQVADGVWQVRGYDVSNLTIVRGKTGWIVVDPLTSRETAAAAMALARKHLGDAPVRAVIYTHSHVDHFGGIAAVLPKDEAERAKVRILAPKGFAAEATSENVLAGLAMGRRSIYQFGNSLPRSVRGYVDSGLGKAPAHGSANLRMPTESIDKTPQPVEIDGVRFVFQYTPDSEAPAELTFYLPAQKAWCGAEIVNQTLHNLYTLRGAKVRDAKKWAGYIDEALRLFPETEVVFMSHTWPVSGAERVKGFLKGQRDTYLFIHDQTLRLANQGLTPREIAEQIELPESLAKSFANRGYYGTVKHNAKAVYQFYFGWYDGNPANLDPHPPAVLGKKYVAAIGGAEKVLEAAKRAADSGDYRFAATLLDHLVFAEPENTKARDLLAGVYDQLGYRAESGVWRSVYLTGAHELRHGLPKNSPLSLAGGLMQNLPIDSIFSAMATRVDPAKAKDRRLVLNFQFSDLEHNWVIELENSVMHHWRREPAANASATVTLTRPFFLKLISGGAGIGDLLMSEELSVSGNRADLVGFFGLLERADGLFPIVTP
jgi:alkyl sulfatase BDS1-like metallo-beta-lactamase superfamily hydrolase